MKYAVVIQKAPQDFSAYVPDLPGCVATGETLEKVTHNVQEAIAFDLEGLREEGITVPKLKVSTVLVEV